MAWTYVTPIATTKDEVRLLIGDTDTTDQQLLDEEINYFVVQESSAVRAAARACETLAAKYARKMNKKMGDLSIEAEKLSKHYMDLATRLFDQGRSTGVPTAGGIEVADRNANQDDDSVTHNAIRRNMHDFEKAPIRPNTQ